VRLPRPIDALRPLCEALAIAGRASPDLMSIDDRPRPGLGPLGGLAGALAYANDQGFAQVLSISVDCVWLPPDILRLLDPAPSCLAGQPVIGLWPATALADLDAELAGDGGRSVRAFAARIGARAVVGDFAPPNINTPADLAQRPPPAPRRASRPPREPEWTWRPACRWSCRDSRAAEAD
jgi:molybdopterin-guanine dinucleotide biosynthesis protein A